MVWKTSEPLKNEGNIKVVMINYNICYLAGYEIKTKKNKRKVAIKNKIAIKAINRIMGKSEYGLCI